MDTRSANLFFTLERFKQVSIFSFIRLFILIKLDDHVKNCTILMKSK